MFNYLAKCVQIKKKPPKTIISLIEKFKTTVFKYKIILFKITLFMVIIFLPFFSRTVFTFTYIMFNTEFGR